MRKIAPARLAAIALLFLAVPLVAAAHQPRIVSGNIVTVEDPEISKAYYDELTGQPRVYMIRSDKPFELYLNLLVPRDANSGGRYGALVLNETTQEQIAFLSPDSVEWTPYYEEFGGDWYLKGPEFNRQVPAGTYSITVSGVSNKGKYVLATGKKEEFPLSETANALVTVPKLKNEFFGSGAPSFASSIMGGAYIFLLLLSGFLAGIPLRPLLGRLFGKKVCKRNTGVTGRALRAGSAVAISLMAIAFWIPVLHLFSGFLLYEAVFAWCPVIALSTRKK